MIGEIKMSLIIKKIKVDIEVIKVEAGIASEIGIDGDTYRLVKDESLPAAEDEQQKRGRGRPKKETPDDDFKKELPEPDPDKQPDSTTGKGNVIARLGGVGIYKNILIAISQGIKDGMGEEELKGIIKVYYPNIKPTSHYTYLRAYMRHIGEQSPKKKKILGFNGTYSVQILKNEVNKVLNCLNLESSPTADLIAKEIGLKRYRALAILSWLKSKSIIKRSMDNEGKTIYKIVKPEWKP